MPWIQRHQDIYSRNGYVLIMLTYLPKKPHQNPAIND